MICWVSKNLVYGYSDVLSNIEILERIVFLMESDGYFKVDPTSTGDLL